MNELSFKFYSIKHNEDAPPYIGKDFLIVADGVGGVGPSPHKLDLEPDEAKEKLFKVAFGDLEEDKIEFLKPYLDEILDTMADKEVDTSARWGSRITLARYAYVLENKPEGMSDLSNPEHRNNICDFIEKGLRAVVKEFDLKLLPTSGMSYLPTTLCSIRYTDNGDTVTAESVWAGDSRAYFITPDGLRCASRDEEGESGGITNFFDGDADSAHHLQYQKFEIKKPCALLCVSDGIFDAFSINDKLGFDPINLGLETHLLSYLFYANSPEHLATMLHDDFHENRCIDDATFCFVPLGFDSFEDIKKAFAPRSEYIFAMYNKFASVVKTLSARSKKEDDVYPYVLQRAKDMYQSKIAKRLEELLRKGEKDIAITPAVIEKLAKKKKALGVSIEEARALTVDGSISALCQELVEFPEHAFIPASKKGSKPRPLADIYINLDKSDNPIIKAIRLKSADLYYKKKEFLEKKKANQDMMAPVANIAGKLDRLAKILFEDLMACMSEEGEKDDWYAIKDFFVSALVSQRSILDHDYFLLEKPRGFIMDELVKSAYDEVNKTFTKAKKTRTEFLHSETQYKIALDKQRAAVKELQKVLDADHSKIPELVTKDGMEEFGLGGKISEKELNIQFNANLDLILKSEDFEQFFVVELTNALKESCDKESAFDEFFNKGRLAEFKEYYLAISTPQEQIQALENELIALSQSYEEELED